MPLPAKWQIVHLNVSTPPFTASQCGLAWQLLTWKLLTWKLLKVYQSLYSGQTSTYTVSHHGAFHSHCNKYNFPIKDKAVLYFPTCQLAPRDACQAFPPPHALIQAGPTLLKNTSVVWGKLIWVSQFLRLVLALWLTSHSFHSLLPKRTRIYWNDFSVSKLVSIVTLWGFVFLKKRWFKVCCQSRLGN